MKSVIPWLGSKRRMAKQIISLMPEHRCYVEVFGGSGAVLFARPEPAEVEVINDLDSELVNLYRVLKHHVGEFCMQFRYGLVSRQLFDWLKITPPETLTDIQRAARFYYLQKLAFGGKRVSQTFGTSATRSPRINLMRIEEDLSEIHQRLASVVIEQLGWSECLDRYDRPETLFLIDPPYWETEGYATPRMDLPDYERLAERIDSLAGRAILTINAHKEMGRIFGHLPHTPVSIRYTVGGGRGSLAEEWVCRSWSA